MGGGVSIYIYIYSGEKVGSLNPQPTPELL